MLNLLSDIDKKKKEALKELEEGFAMVDDLFKEFKEAHKKKKANKERKRGDNNGDDECVDEVDENHEKAKYSRGIYMYKSPFPQPERYIV